MKTYLIGERYDAEKMIHGGDRRSEDAKSSDKSCHLIPPVLRLKSVGHFDPLISGVALCAQKAGQGVCRQRSPATGFKKPATSSCPALILFLFFSLISLLLSLSEKNKAL